MATSSPFARCDKCSLIAERFLIVDIARYSVAFCEDFVGEIVVLREIVLYAEVLGSKEEAQAPIKSARV